MSAPPGQRQKLLPVAPIHLADQHPVETDAPALDRNCTFTAFSCAASSITPNKTARKSHSSPPMSASQKPPQSRPAHLRLIRPPQNSIPASATATKTPRRKVIRKAAQPAAKETARQANEPEAISAPYLPIQRPVLDRLAQVLGGDFFGAGEVGDGAGDLEDAGRRRGR